MSSGMGKLTRVACGALAGIVLVMAGTLHGQKLVTPGYCLPLPFDNNYEPKAAFYALQTTLAHALPTAGRMKAGRGR